MEPYQNKQQNHSSASPLRVGTFNVHSFSDGNCEDTYEEICELLCDANLDIIGLQEAKGNRLPCLLSRLGKDTYTLAARYGGTAILTRLPVVEGSGEKLGKGRYCSCEVVLPCYRGENRQTLSVMVVHLDHKEEKKRLSEIKSIVQAFRTKGAPLCDLWLGDFNALTQSDYSRQHWREITQVRSRNNWELPVSDLTSAIVVPAKRKQVKRKQAEWKGLGLTDAFKALPEANRSGPLSTCRFGTRIDYVYYQDLRLRETGWRIAAIVHHDSKKCSDHNLVIATFENTNTAPGV